MSTQQIEPGTILQWNGRYALGRNPPQDGDRYVAQKHLPLPFTADEWIVRMIRLSPGVRGEWSHDERRDHFEPHPITDRYPDWYGGGHWNVVDPAELKPMYEVIVEEFRKGGLIT